MFVHIFFLIGFRNRFVVLFAWAWAYFTYQRSARIILEDPSVRDDSGQASGKPVPAFRQPGKDKAEKRVEVVEVKRRGKGEAFGLNIPQEPLLSVGAKPGTKFSVMAYRGRVVLRVQ